MITQHPVFRAPPNKEILIWRYMDLTKFLWTLQAKALYFARSDNLGDPFEGHYTEYLSGDHDSVAQRLFGSTEIKGERAISAVEGYRGNVIAQKKQLFVNCWHMNEDESEAMWRIYAGHHSSVCVQSTYRQLADVLPEGTFLGCVRYIDYKNDPIPAGNVLSYITHKRRSYAHERELRAVHWSSNPIGAVADCMVTQIDLNALIQKIYVSPSSDPTLLPIVRDICKKYEVNADVVQSGVNAPPAF